jgi:hypothetical protein
MPPIDEKEAELRRELSELKAQHSAELDAIKRILVQQETTRESVRSAREEREKVNARKRGEERRAINTRLARIEAANAGAFANPRVRLVLQFLAMLIASFASQHR